MFIKYSTSLIPPKKSRGKGSHGKKAVVSPKPTSVEVSDETDSKRVRRRTSKEEAARLVHATHEKMETKSDLKPARIRPSEEQLAVDTMQALKASKKSSRRQPNTRGSSEGTSSIPEVLDESIVVFSTSSEGTGSEEESEYNKEDDVDENIDWVGTDEKEEKNDDDDDKNDDEETDDEFIHGDEQVNEDEDEEITNDEDADTGNGDEQITDTAKADAEKTEEVKDDIMKAEFPPSSSSLSVSSVPHIQSPSTLTVLVLVIPEPLVLPPIPETTMTAPPVTSTINSVLQQQSTQILTPPISTEAPSFTTTVLEISTITPAAFNAIQSRVTNLEKDVTELKKVDHSAEILATIRSLVLDVVNEYLGSSLGDALLKVLQKHTADLIQQQSQKQLIDLEKEPTKSTSEILKKRPHDNEDEDPSTGPNQGKKNKRTRTKESESSKKTSTNKETSRGKAPTKGSKADKSATTEESVKEPITDVVMDYAVNPDAEDWFTQPPRPPTPDPE
ncbi:hypothetical protein Tco_0039574 [Tanacetum coccineum]